MDALDLARVQFAGTTAIHWVLVVLTLGLAPLVAVMHTRAATARDPERARTWERATLFWGRLYVVNYAVGIVSGLVIEFQFGLGWSGLSTFAGSVFGAPLAIETLVAFFAESTFLGLWMFGWGRLHPRVHVTLIWLVALTAYASAYWILVANGFLQNPVGSAVRDGVSHLVDVTALLTNPNALLALGHVVSASLLAGGLFLAGISAVRLRRGDSSGDLGADRAVYRHSARMGTAVAAFVGYVAYAFGGLQYPQLAAVQPMKSAVLEPGPGLDALAASLAARYGGAPADHVPPQYAVLGQYVMLYLGYLLFLLAIAAFLVAFADGLRRRRVLGTFTVLLLAAPAGEYVNALAHRGEAVPGQPLWYAVAVVALGSLLLAAPRLSASPGAVRAGAAVMAVAVPLPFVAAVGGWLFREGGRQPWLITGQLRTADAVSPLPGGAVLMSTVTFVGVLAAVLVVDVALLVRLSRRGPDAHGPAPWEPDPEPEDRTAPRPLLPL